MSAYYNENDRFNVAWLRELINEGHIATGDVDERSIEDVQPSDLEGYTQVHLFAGIGGWSLALRLAGWPDDRPVWTGSCPCQPFSAAGKRLGEADERHLWPEMRRLIAERRPATCFGEQVSGTDGVEWLTGVRTDLEALGYEVGAADLCAASVGAPHIRQRLWWVADAKSSVGHGNGAESRKKQGRSANGGGLGNTNSARHKRAVYEESTGPKARGGLLGVGRSGGFWDSARLVACADGKARRIEPGLEPLADGLPGRVGRLRGYGCAIVSQVAAKFIHAYTTC